MVGQKKTKASGTLDASVRILVLHGQDDMLKRIYLQQMRYALQAEHGEVEIHQMEGPTAQLAEVFDELRSYSLMQQYKLVVVDDAELFVTTHRKALERYADNPVDHATLVLRSTNWNRGNLDKKIAKVGARRKCDALDAAQATDWLIKRMGSEHKRTIDKDAAAMLIRRVGRELMKLDSEAAKLALLVEADQPIDVELIEQTVGRSSDEQAWMVQEAVLAGVAKGSAGRTLEKIHELVALSGQPEVLVVYFVADIVRKLGVARSMREAGLSESQIGRELKLWGPRQALFMQVLPKLDGQAVEQLFDRVLELDGRSKSGFGKPLRNLECFCVALADI
jgi:DNA polymerase-3 subunit delta